MTGIFLLDTNAAIARIGGDEAIKNLLEAAEELYVPSIVLGELYYGAENSGRVAANLLAVNKLAADITVLNCDIDTARHYGRIRRSLRVKGQPVSENDVWIAAIAMQYGLTLLTRDADFNSVDGLQVVGW